MRLSLVGINHQTAPVTIRESVAVSTEKLNEVLSLLRTYIPFGVILSTCNRTEIYTIDGAGYDARKVSLEFLQSRLKVTDTDLLQYVYAPENGAVAEHLFRVAGGLESMILGEYEVLGQIGQALEAAEKSGMVNLPLRQAFQSAIRTGRRVREETGISKNALSVSSAAVDLATRVVGDLKACKMLVIGAGEAGRLVAKVAKERGTSQIVIASRTKERAQAVATTLNGIPIDMRDVTGELAKTNILVTCAGAPHPIVNADNVEKVMRDRPELPLVIIDIAVPRNVEPGVGGIKNVFLYNIDDLNEIANFNRKQRENAIQLAEKIVKEEVDKFMAWWHDCELRPIISALMSKAEEIRSVQLSKTLKKWPLLSDEQRDNLEAMTKSIVTRILNDPIQFLRNNDNGEHSEVVKELFQLNTEGQP